MSGALQCVYNSTDRNSDQVSDIRTHTRTNNVSVSNPEYQPKQQPDTDTNTEPNRISNSIADCRTQRLSVCITICFPHRCADGVTNADVPVLRCRPDWMRWDC